jgi:hypothetical protein
MADTWIITGQRQTTTLAGNGNGFVDIWEITFRITGGPAQGSNGTFRIPADLYNVDNVRAGVQAQADQMSGVAGL